jgi:protoheme IX farnesyltransferase
MNERQVITLRRLTLTATVLTFLLLVAGNLVRVSGDGPGCPDWPLCFGAALPLDNGRAVAEVVHRAFAALTGFVIVVLATVCLRWRASERMRRWSVIALVLVLAEVALGALTVLTQWQATITALHLILGLAALGLVGALHIEARYIGAPAPEGEVTRATQRFRRSLGMLAGAVFVLLITGALVAGNGAALACGQTFPICNGGFLPNGGRLVLVQWLHRLAVVVLALLLVSFARKAFGRGAQLSRPVKMAAAVLLAGFVVQGALGWLMVSLNRPAILATLHNGLSAVIWLSALALAMLANRSPVFIPDPPQRPVPAWRQTVNDYVALTKPRVISLLLFTTLAGMFITSAGAPPWYLVLWTMIGGYLMAGGANAVNMAYDADIDNVMGRTSKRPTVSGRIPPRRAFIFGLALALASFAIFLLFVNWLAALLAVLGFLYYTVIYTRWLKRSTWQNIVIGGGAGAIPPLIGWAAASGQLTLSAVILFVIVFYWTPPHFWALALMKRKDYAAAGVPMLPVVAGEDETVRQILIYSVGMLAITLVLVPLRAMGAIYLLGALVLGGLFVWKAWQLNHDRSPIAVLSLYKYSLLYLFALFALMMVDRMSLWI